jgi:two-component system, NarL family, nitrate/nitrite response regulator NarL
VIRVYIVADVRLYRDGLARILDRTPGIAVVGSAANVESAAGELNTLSPEIVLLDMVTPGSVAAASAILTRPQPPKIVALAVPNAEDELVACAEAGISGFVTRDDAIETMVEAIERVARGELLTTPRIAAALLERVRALSAASLPGEAPRLTPREREIVDLIDAGLSNKEIAQRLRIELPTVKNHVHNILEKLQVARRADVATRLRATRGARRSSSSGVAD